MTRPEQTRHAVFSGAGLSGEAPASLPRGFALRNDVLGLMHAVAGEVAPELVAADSLAVLVTSQRKLEVVLGRLWGTVGEDGLQCLLALLVEVPNEAHLLAALHLMRGGMHVTLNFDVGIELAYALLSGSADLPPTAPAAYRELLPMWQSLAPDHVEPLRVVASRADFALWVEDGKPPALLKAHGSLSPDQLSLVDVVAVDIEELGQLSGARLAAVGALGEAERLLITGYSGADPDVYEPLLAAAEATVSAWCCYQLDDRSPVPADAAARGIDLRLKAPDGLAVTALQQLLGDLDVPRWPELTVSGLTYQDRFDQWALWLRNRHSAQAITQAWAWLVADLGDLDTAVAIMRHLVADANRDAATVLRYAELLYSRARGDDRDRAAELFRHLAATRGVSKGLRNHCRLRASDIARGHAIRGNRNVLRALPYLARAVAGPLRVLVATCAGRADTEAAADAFRALQQTGLRTLEFAGSVAPKTLWPVIAIMCRALTVFGRRAETLAANGNRRALVRSHRLLLTALAALFAGRPPHSGLADELRSLHNTYLNADDLPGAGTCSVALAVVAGARGDLDCVDFELAAARAEFTQGRADGIPIMSGAALLAVTRRILNRSRPTDDGQSE